MYYGQNEDFLKEEIRDGWKISAETKKVWAVQFDLIRVFKGICEKYNLRYYAIFGTLLGVVRHNGYIPWDDDIDFGMPREDYDKFISVCTKELIYPYFLQTTLSDIESYEIHSSLRNSETTGNCDFNMRKRCNNGIAIDIVPIDGCSPNYFLFYWMRKKIKFMSTLCNTYVNEVNRSSAANILRKVLRRFCKKFPYKKIYIRNEKKLRRIKFKDSSKVSTVLIADNTARELYWDREDFDDIIMSKFENIELPIPKGFDRNLRTIYGDYMKFPPLGERGDKHHIIYAPDVPYKEYCNNHYGVNYELDLED